MFRRPAILLLTSAVLLGTGCWVAWHWQDSNPASSIHSKATSAAILPRWAPLFIPRPDTEACLALARTIDSSFELQWLGPWCQRLAPAALVGPDAERVFLIFNEVVETLRLKGIAPPMLTAELVKILADAKIHPVFRDYSAQHLGLLAEAHPELTDPVVVAFCDALEEPANRHLPLLGTVLNAAGDLNARRSLTPTQLARFAARRVLLLGDSTLNLPLRISLVQSITPADAMACRPVLHAVAMEDSGKQPTALLIAIAGTLGRIGSAEDLPALESLRRRGGLASSAGANAIGRITRSTASHPAGRNRP